MAITCPSKKQLFFIRHSGKTKGCTAIPLNGPKILTEMNVTNELLDRYSRNLCTPAERELVESWLDSVHEEAPQLTASELQALDSEVWIGLAKGVKSGKGLPLPRTLLRYAAGIALATGLLSGSFWAGSNSGPQTIAKTSVKDEHPAPSKDNMLYFSNIPGTSKKVAASSCELSFEGVLRVYNSSPSPKLVTCDGKTLSASPGKVTYYLNTKTKGFRQIDFRSGEMLFYENQLRKSTFSICV